MRTSGFAVRLMRTTVFTGAALAFAAPAFSQEVDASADVVTVTGSRVANPNLEQASQIQVIGEDEILLQSVNSAEELIRQLPGAVPNIGPAVNNGNGGAQTINLRGIGANRNLVLLDSKRIVPFGLEGITDLNHIPIALIERVDIVTGGASSVYGADAVSGLVNFITKRNFEGVEVQASYRTTQRGDGETYRTEVVAGGNFAEGRGNAVFSLGYQNARPVLQGDRDFGQFNVSSITGLGGGSSATVPAVIAGPGGVFGTINPDTGAIGPFDNPFNFNPLNLYQTPVERFNIFGKAHYEIANGIEAYTDGFFTRSIVETQIAPTASFFNTYQLPLSNPFLPVPARNQLCVGAGISQAACDLAGATTDPNDPNYAELAVGIRRRFVEQGPRLFNNTTDAFQVGGGLRGDLNETWSWDLGAHYGESTKVLTTGGNGTFTRLQQSLRAVDATTCQDPTDGCVPVNLFGPAGTLGDDYLAFNSVTTTTTDDTSLGTVNLSLSGDLGEFRSPFAAEPIGVAFGGEYRRYTARSAGDFLSAIPGEVLGSGGADPVVGGNYDALEGFAEVIAPVIQDRPLFHSFTIEAGVRVSDYSTTGTSVTWKAGGTWEPVENYKIRSIYQRAVRSPNIFELFFPVTTVLDNFATDPCAGAAPVGNPTLTAICVAQGAPAASIGGITDPAAGQVNITTGGNLDLDVERATTFTVGLVGQPDFIPGLTFNIDYFNIQVTDAISSPEVGDIINGCFDAALNPGLDFNVSCAAIERNAIDGSLNGSPADTRGVILQTSNLGLINTSGLDFGLSYAFDLGGAGRLTYAGNGTYTFENRFEATPASVDRDCVGFYSTNCGNIQSEFQSNQRLTWSYNILDLSLQHRFLGGVEIEPELAGTFQPEFETIGSRHCVDLTARANISEMVQLTATIDNLLDRSPPIVGADVGPTAFNSGNTYPTVYDALGRTFTIGARLRF